MSESLSAVDSFVKRHGLWSETQWSAAQSLIDRFASGEYAPVDVMRVSFVDQHGVQRGKTISVESFANTVCNGVTMTSTLLLKDTSHRTVFPVWQSDAGFGEGAMTGASDLIMVPDPTTFKVLPWAPDNGWVLADLYFKDGTPCPYSTRGLLIDALGDLEKNNQRLVAGLEVEFYVFRELDAAVQLDDAGQPGAPPELGLVSHGYQYLTEDVYDQLDDVFRVIRKAAIALDMPVRSFEVEFGPSQCEVTLEPQEALKQADTMVLFRSMVKQVCRRHGLHATFMCRPPFEAAMASGWHLHQSLVDATTGRNLFVPEDGALSVQGMQWLAGLLEHARESCLFSTPTINGYKRYREFSLAPDRIQWGQDNRGAMLRCLGEVGNAASRIENRVGEPAANPYLYLLSQVLSGADGLRRELTPPPPVDQPYASDAERLPRSFPDAVAALKASSFYREQLGDAFVDYYTTIKDAEWARFMASVTDWEAREYLRLF